MKQYINWKTASIGIVFLALVIVVGMSFFGTESKELRDPKTVTVRIKQKGFAFDFEPEEMTILQGDTVRWVPEAGDGETSYTIKFQDAPEGALDQLSKADLAESPPLKTSDDEWTITFSREFPPGTYHYYCPEQEDMGMEGWITVEPRPESSPFLPW